MRRALARTIGGARCARRSCAALGVAGCGGVGVSGASSAVGNQLTIYSSLPLQGPSGPSSQQIVNGEKLALGEAGGRIGPFKISYLSMDDSNTTTGEWNPGRDRDEREDGRRGHHARSPTWATTTRARPRSRCR